VKPLEANNVGLDERARIQDRVQERERDHDPAILPSFSMVNRSI
jgi:hypothetical protein